MPRFVNLSMALEIPTSILVLSEVDESEENIHATIRETFNLFGLNYFMISDSLACLILAI